MLAKVMKYRNAFAHGEVRQTPKGVFLKYFEGQPREEKLTDAYWRSSAGRLRGGAPACHVDAGEVGGTPAPAPPPPGAPSESA